MLFSISAPTENTSERAFIDVGAETKSRKGNKVTKKVFLILFVILAVLLLVFLALCNTEAFVRTATAYKLNALNGGTAQLVSTSALTVYVDDGFALEVTHLKEITATHKADLFYPFFAVKNNGRWVVSCFGRSGIYPFSNTSESSIYTGGNYLSRIGDYTIICISDRMVDSKAFKSIADNIGTKIVYLSAQDVAGATEDANWEFFNVTADGRLSPARLRRNIQSCSFCLLVVRDMPKNYEAYIAGQTLTFEEIEEQLIAYPNRIIPFTMNVTCTNLGDS